MMKQSIRFQLIVIICSLIVLALASTVMISYSFISAEYEKKMKASNSAMAESLGGNIAQFMTNAGNINRMLAEYPGLLELDVQGQKQLLREITEKYPWFQLLAITDLNGQQIARSSGVEGDRAGRPWFKRFMQMKKPYVTNTYYSVTTESPITTIVHGIYRNGRLDGIMMADIEVSKIQRMVETYNSGEGSYAYLLDGDGAVVAHPDREQVADLYNYRTMKKKVLVRDTRGHMEKDGAGNELTREENFSIAPSLRPIVDRALAGEIGEGEYTASDGEPYICAYRMIQLPGASDHWSLIVVQKKSAVMAFMNSVMLKFAVISLLAIIFSVLLAVWLSKKITDPIVEIVAATDRIREEDLSVQIPVHAENEVGFLARNFNRMMQRLRDHHERLEELVKERTAELADANDEMRGMNRKLSAVNGALADTNRRLQEENEARQKTEDALLRRERQYGAIMGLLTRPADQVNDILKTILENAVQLANANGGYVGLFEKNGTMFSLYHGIGINAALEGTSRVAVAERGLKAQVYKSGQMLWLEDYQENALQERDGILPQAASCVIMVPLRQGNKVLGILAVNWVGAIYGVKTEELDGLRQFGDMASIALERELTHREIRKIAFKDALTGLPNRISLNLYLAGEMNRAHGGEARGVILFIDIDDFKSVNDNFGHSFGDDLLIAAGRQIIASVGKEAFVSRLGGDEFIVVIPGKNDRDASAAIAERVTRDLCREYEILDKKVHMSGSVGVVLYPEDGDIAEDLLKKADSAMYAAKQAGRNCWRFYEPILLQEAYEKMILTNGLRRSLERNELYLAYQPQLTADGAQIVGFEALLRWRSAEYGQVTPDRFIPLAEQSGLIVPIGRWVLEEACRFAKRLAAAGKAHVRVAVNVSSRQLMTDDFVGDVRAVLAASGINPAQIELEITESVLIESMEESVAKLCELRRQGIRLALDDFGTGYSSLTYLRKLPVDVLKIDKSFIDQIVQDDTQRQVVGSIVDLGHRMGLWIISEGVEVEMQQRILLEFGCDCIQGYIFSRPLAPERAMELLEA